ncbi:MAG TPA: cytochrome P450 [Rubrivivax sp.]|nr:cytochrome P450 [Rubrivivax sp.]
MTHDAAAARALAQGFTLAGAGDAFIDDPYPTYAALREFDPVHALAPGSWLLTRYDDVLAVYRDARASSDKRREFAPKFGASPLFEHHTTSLVFNDPPLHTRVRRLLLGALNQRAIARMEAGVVALVDGLLDRLQGLQAPDLIEDFAARIPVEVIGNLLDVPHADRAPLRGWSLAILGALEPSPSVEVLARGNAAVNEFKHYLAGLVAHRRRHPGDAQADVLTRLIQGEVGGEGTDSQGGAGAGPPRGREPGLGLPGARLSELELLHNCIFLLNAGHETTTNLIGNGLHALLGQHDQWMRLVAEPAWLGSAVEELLRFESPLQLNNRVTTAELGIGGVRIPAGSFLTLAIGAANRDPAHFHQPDRLDVARNPNPHLAFGHGAHACAGMNVARLEARIAFGRFLARYPGLQLSGTPVRDRRIRFRGWRTLPVNLR